MVLKQWQGGMEREEAPAEKLQWLPGLFATPALFTQAMLSLMVGSTWAVFWEAFDH